MSAQRRAETLAHGLTTSARLSMNDCAHFAHITEAPADEIFNTGIRYRADTDPRKVDLGKQIVNIN